MSTTPAAKGTHVPLSKEERRQLDQIERALVREDPEFLAGSAADLHRRHRTIAVITACCCASVLLMVGGFVLSISPVAGFILGSYGVLTMAVAVAVFLHDGRTVA